MIHTHAGRRFSGYSFPGRVRSWIAASLLTPLLASVGHVTATAQITPFPGNGIEAGDDTCFADLQVAMRNCILEDRSRGGLFGTPDDPTCQESAQAKYDVCTGNGDDTGLEYVINIDAATIRSFEFDDFDNLGSSVDSAPELPRKFARGTVTLEETGAPGSLRDSAPEAVLGRKSLVIAAPTPDLAITTDFVRGEYVLILTAPDGDTARVRVVVRPSVGGASIEDNFHNVEDDPELTPPVLPELVISGLSTDGRIGEADLVIAPVEDSPLDRDATEVFAFDSNFDGLEVTQLFDYDAATNGLRLPRAAAQGLLAQLPQGTNSLEARMRYAGNAHLVSVVYTNGGVSLTGQLVDADGNAVTVPGGLPDDLEVVVQGVNTTYRDIVSVDASGAFSVQGLPSGETYRLIVSDLRFPNTFQTFSTLFPNTSQADVELRYDPSVFGADASQPGTSH